MRRLPQLNIYKKSGALQLRLLLPDLTEQYPKPGCVMLEICPGRPASDGNVVYNWTAEKITIKLNDRDVADILSGLQGRTVKIIHDPNAGSQEGGSGPKKFLEVSPGQQEGTVFIRCSYGDKKASVALDANEILRSRLLLAAAIPAIYGWN